MIFLHINTARWNASASLCPLESLQAACAGMPPALDFCQALQNTHQQRKRPALIAEIKRASPSRGLLAADFDPLRLALTYQQNGAAAISVLTDEHFFQGSLEFLKQVRAAFPHLPLLRKDFIFDAYQVYEARAAGADALLLIAAHLTPTKLCELFQLTRSLGMAALVEVHDSQELEKALVCKPRLVGVNNRNLHTFEVNLETSLSLAGAIPGGVSLVAESGIHTPQDVERLAAAGVTAILVGEALVTAADIAAKVRSLAW